jgi:dTDP-D-glucose 4,6-dehydratase
VKDLIVEMKRYWKKADWVDVSSGKEEFHEAGLLKLNCDKALKDLDWRPTLQFEETVRMTSEWYNRYYESDETDMQEFTLDQINQYIDFANKRKISWAK